MNPTSRPGPEPQKKLLIRTVLKKKTNGAPTPVQGLKSILTQSAAATVRTANT
jgi:hypothetical protein